MTISQKKIEEALKKVEEVLKVLMDDANTSEEYMRINNIRWKRQDVFNLILSVMVVVLGLMLTLVLIGVIQ